MRKQKLSLIFISLTIGGCALLGPKYQEPQLNMPENWSSKDNNTQVSNQQISEIAWWKNFNDAQLNSLIESALINNNNLQIAVGNLLQSQASLQKVNMGWVPQLNISTTGFVGQSFNPSFENANSNSTFTPSQNNPQGLNGYFLGAMPSYSLNVFSQIKQGEIAKLNVKLQTQSVNAIRLAVISQVASSYFTLLGLHKQLQIQEQLLSDAQEMRKYNEIKYKNGNTTQLNVDGIDQFISDLKAKIPEIKSDITKTENAIQVLTNNNPGKIIINNNFDNIQTNDIIPVNLPSLVLKNRPDIAIAEYQLKINNANIGLATSQFFPTINLTGNIGQSSIQLANLFNSSNDFWLASLGAAIPIFNLGLYADIDKAKAGYYSAYYNYIQTVRNAFAQVDNALSTNDSLNQQYKEHIHSYQKANDMYKLGNTQYKNGAISFANTIGFKLNVDYSKAKLNQLKMQQMSSIVNLYQVLAGGYNAESSLTQVKKFQTNHDIN